jgi:hypothetical protein
MKNNFVIFASIDKYKFGKNIKDEKVSIICGIASGGRYGSSQCDAPFGFYR